MAQTPASPQTARGFAAPLNIQFSVFLDNRVGRLLDLMEVFENRGLALAGLSVNDSADHAVVRMLTSNAVLARCLLKREEHPYSEAEVLAVEINQEKSLNSLCRSLLAAEVNIHYAYPLLVQPKGMPAIVIYTDDILLSAQILRRKLFTLLAENDLSDNSPRGTPGLP